MDESEIYFERNDDETLVKVNIVDDNNPSETTCATIPQEYYERIVSGQSALRKEYDEEGNVQFVLVDVDAGECGEEEEEVSTLSKVINNTSSLLMMGEVKKTELSCVEEPQKVKEELKGEEYIIREIPASADTFMVVIADSQGLPLYQKEGHVGETLVMDLCGNAISYLISGHNDDGSIRQTNVYINEADTDKGGDLSEAMHQEQQVMIQTEGLSEAHDTEDCNEEEYIISEEAVLINDINQQMIRLSDKHRNVLDTKYGVKDDTVKLQLTDKAFEYLIQGPLDTGEPIITTFMINKSEEVYESNDQQVEDPAAQWCPPELSKEDYAAIRDAAREIAANLESANELPAVQPYSERLGTKSAYEDLVDLVERYKSRAEERKNDLLLLRRHSKLYMSAKPNARKLTQLELTRNEAAAQVCRYIPALLFHKRKLYDCALLVVERSGLFTSDIGHQNDTQEEFSDDNRPFTGPVTAIDDVHTNVLPPTTRPHAASSVINVSNYMANDMTGSSNIFNQGFPSFGKRDLQLTSSEESAIKNAADRLQEELYQYPIKSKSDCQHFELQIRDELVGLKDLLDGSQTEVEQAHEYMRETSAVNGRFHPTQRGRHLPLSPYDVAVNEAAYHLVRNNIGLLIYRKILTDLARKVIRSSGCNFRHNTMGDKKEYNAANLWLYNQDNIPELDLSSAVKVLSDPLEDGPILSLLHSSFVPVIEETLIKSDLDNDEDDEDVYRPIDFKNKEVLGNVNMECDAERNILNECAIYCHTGTDDLKKVRILDLQDCAFTSIMPIDINYCYNLVELNLSDNSLSYLPRCLFLPNLTKLNLRNNRFVTVPLLEQFTKLVSVEVDDKIVRKLNKESLTFFCVDLAYINNKKFDGIISDEFNSIFLEAKTHIETMVQNRWEEDLAMYFKKGVRKNDCQKVIETLVLNVRERRIFNEQHFFNFKDLIARRVAENFLDSKIIDDDEEEEYKEKVAEDMETDDDEENNEVSKVPRSMYKRRNEFDNQTVEKGQILLNDEPLDRLTNVVGQALRSGKTVVYSVMRTAARQPGGDLIPVGGGDNNQNNSYLLSSKKLITEDCNMNSINDEKHDEIMKTKPGPASFKKRKYGIVQSPSDTDEDLFTRETVQKVIDDVMEKVESFNTNVKRRVGRPKMIKPQVIPLDKMRPNVPKEVLENHKKDLFKVPKTLQEEIPTENYAPEIIKKDKKPSEFLLSQIEDIVRDCSAPVTTAKMREMLGMTIRGRPSCYITEACMRSYKKFNQEMPDPYGKSKNYSEDMQIENTYYDDSEIFDPNIPSHVASSTTKVATRVSNQFKKFHPLGVRDLNESNFSSDNDEKMDTSLIHDFEYTPTPKRSKDSPTDRSSSSISEVNSNNSILNELRKNLVEKERLSARTQKPLSGVVVPLHTSSIFSTSRQSKNTEGQHKIPDYDPLHFIRCHARDNNPLDCATKVWRCAFEPNPNNPYMETTSVVATCGGECVCLIDCKTGKVMKRFKSREEEFYTVAWTTVEMAAGHYINILAAAGKMKDIRLLHPEQLVCYAEMKGHELEIACMTFHPRYPTVLFSGDAMANIFVWDIGIPSAPDYTTHYQLLTRLSCPRAHLNPVLNLVVMPSYECLVAGCEDGVFVWNFPEFRKCKPDDVRTPDFEVKVPTHQEPCFDGLARLSENTLLVKCVEEGEIFTINFGQIIQHYKARKFDDQCRVVADVIGWLRWQITDEIYINVTAQMNLSTVMCGDNEGTIWLYDMTKEVNDENNTKKFKTKPEKILDWPECSVESNPKEEAGTEKKTDKNPIINCVEMSSDGAYLVAVTDNNLVCIWSVPVNVS